jgi:hypothetical protein
MYEKNVKRFFFKLPNRTERNFKVDKTESIGKDTKRIKVTNHSNYAAAVTQLAKVGENQIMKVTRHSNLALIKSYLQINSEHHEKIIQKMRSNNSKITRSDGSSIETPSSTSSKVSYSSCVFNNCSF